MRAPAAVGATINLERLTTVPAPGSSPTVRSSAQVISCLRRNADVVQELLFGYLVQRLGKPSPHGGETLLQCCWSHIQSFTFQHDQNWIGIASSSSTLAASRLKDLACRMKV